MDHQQIWTQIKSSLKSKNQNNKPLQMWLEPTDLLSVDQDGPNSCFRLGVPSELHKYWISQNLVDMISLEISAVYRNPFELRLEVTGSPQDLGEESQIEMIEPTPAPTQSSNPIDIRSKKPLSPNSRCLEYRLLFFDLCCGAK